MGGRWEVKYQWCPDGLFHGLSLEQHRSVMNSNLRGNMGDVCISTGLHQLSVSKMLIFFPKDWKEDLCTFCKSFHAMYLNLQLSVGKLKI